MADEYIFVYGTLRKNSNGPKSHLLSDHCHYLSDGYIVGALYDLGDYPGVVLSEDPINRVYGECFKLENSGVVLSELDEWEECSASFPDPKLYLRKSCRVILGGNLEVKAWVYIYNRDVTPHTYIRSGDYLTYLMSK
ncbi:MAG: gamma-glutamylcyclotransferase family protein [Pseudomonas marincola]